MNKATGVFTLTDKSTNGTFLNDKKLSKGETTNLHNGDKIYLLNDEACNEKIGFIFVAVFQKPGAELGKKRSRDQMEADEEEKKEVDNNKRINRQDTPAAVQQMKCSFCLEIMYKPVSLIPCLHNFCGGCYADWMKTHNDCPECRDKVKHIKRNHMINSMIDDYLKKNPSEEKSKETKEDQDEKDCFDNKVVSYQNAKKMKKEHDEKVAKEKKQSKSKPKKEVKKNEEDKKDEEEKKENKKEEDKEEVKAQPSAPRRNVNVQCKNCTKLINGFQCKNDTRHVVCAACKNMFPLSGKPNVHVQ